MTTKQHIKVLYTILAILSYLLGIAFYVIIQSGKISDYNLAQYNKDRDITNEAINFLYNEHHNGWLIRTVDISNK